MLKGDFYLSFPPTSGNLKLIPKTEFGNHFWEMWQKY